MPEKKTLLGDKMNLRPLKQEDLPQILHLFHDTIHTICTPDCTKEQLEAWSDINTDRFTKKLLDTYTIVMHDNETIIGFGNIDTDGCLDCLYVHKDFQKQGVASKICDILEDTVKHEIITHASITALSFFLNRGYTIVQPQIVIRHDIKLKNYILKKKRI